MAEDGFPEVVERTLEALRRPARAARGAQPEGGGRPAQGLSVGAAAEEEEEEVEEDPVVVTMKPLWFAVLGLVRVS